MTDKKEIQQEIHELRTKLLEAYDIAGSLRDTFSSYPENDVQAQGHLKEFCNKIRGGLYDARTQSQALATSLNNTLF